MGRTFEKKDRVPFGTVNPFLERRRSVEAGAHARGPARPSTPGVLGLGAADGLGGDDAHGLGGVRQHELGGD
ncbi:hypothetical protein, partial [Nocardiopsis alba]|uniref:hypothetical protein n=1 Tax=Nocardiopsis alba TaxID=53437 RepID=UPI00340EE94E